MDETAERYTGNGKIIPIVGDVTDKASLRSAAEQIQRQTNYINLLLCNSGITGPKVTNTVQPTSEKSIYDIQQDLWNVEPSSWAQTFDTNVSAVYFTTVAFLPLLYAGNQAISNYTSVVIVTSSIAGFSKQISSGFAYSASKAAATHLARCLGWYFAKLPIRVNVLAPGLFPSEMTSSDRDEATGRSRLILEEDTDVPAGRAGTEREIAGLGLYMASPSGGYLNGAVITPDGGRLLTRPSIF